MFILIPLILILASVIGISVIVFRKMPYLNKLTPETHTGGDFLTELFPEFSGVFKGSKLRRYSHLWLLELEKFLRKLRLVSLRIDRVSEAWIKKIKKGQILSIVPVVEEKTEIVEAPVLKVQSAPKISLEEMKKEEQRLIIEIAKKPKDSVLYEKLGDLYVKMKDLSDAKESYEAAIELGPSDEKLQKKLSKVTEKLSAQSN